MNNLKYNKYINSICHGTSEINRPDNELGQYLFPSSLIFRPGDESGSASPSKLFLLAATVLHEIGK